MASTAPEPRGFRCGPKKIIMAKYLLVGENINWMAIMALVTFFLIFSLTLIMVFGRKSKQYDHVSSLPLDDKPQLPKE
jgi:hypothetical protein